MSFKIVFDYILTRTGVGCGAGLDGLTALLERLGNPQERFKVIHIAGTNGKGSVAALTAETLRQAGYKTGLFVSPHLCDPCERIQVNAQNISKADFASAVLQVFQEEEQELNFFEILTAAALCHFARAGVDYAVLETGLGGRKDPTNVCTPAACVITSIGLDHMQLLGSSLAQIAREKAGIIKTGVPCFSGAVNPSAREEIKKIAKEKNAPLTFVEEGQPFFTYAFDFPNNQTILHTADGQEWALHALGRRQGLNACVVYQLAQCLHIPQEAVRRAFETVRLPGRFEVLHRPGQTLILDGAHNPQAIELFLEFFKATPYAGKATLLCGFMKDKDYKKMLSLLVPHFKQIVVTVPSPTRGAGKEEILEALPKGVKVRFFKNPSRALTAVKQEPYVVCAGSFYLVGFVRRKWLQTLRPQAGKSAQE